MRFIFKIPLFFIFLTSISGASDLELQQQESSARPQPKWLKSYVNQGEFNKALEGYYTPPGIKLEIVASAPVVVNPVGMTFDDEGHAYVLEWPAGGPWREVLETFNYRDGSSRQTITFKKTLIDKVKLLNDSKGTGVFDSARTIIEDDLPSSILVHENKIYLSGRGTIRRYGMNANKQYVFEQNIAKGFCGFHHHQVSGMTIGNDGRLYIASGDNDNVVEGSDGSRADLYRNGGVFRSKIDGSQMEIFALGFRNPYRDVAFDLNQNMFHLDNDNEDGSKFTGCRLMHVSEGSDYGWRLREGNPCCAPDHKRGAVFGELPGKATPLIKTGRGAPAGLLIYNDSQFPAKYQGLLLYPDVFRKNIRAYRIEPKGSSFEVVEEFELLKTEDPLFRPSQMLVGPDGGIYIVDWRTNSGGAGQLSGDGINGRIYRMSWQGDGVDKAIPLRSKNSWSLGQATITEIMKAIEGPDASVRERARRELVKRKEPLLLSTLFSSNNKNTRIAAVGGLQALWNAEIQNLFLTRLEKNQEIDADVRRLMIEAVGIEGTRGSERITNLLQTYLLDIDPKTVRAAALALAKIGNSKSVSPLIEKLKQLAASNSSDRNLIDGVIRSLEKLKGDGIEALIVELQNAQPQQINFWVEAVASLRTSDGFSRLGKVLLSKNLTPKHVTSLLKSIGNYQYQPIPDSVPLILEFIKKSKVVSPEVDAAAVEGLLFLGNAKNPNLLLLVNYFLGKKSPQVLAQVLQLIEEKNIVQTLPTIRKRLLDEGSDDGKLALLKTIRFFKDAQSLSWVLQLTHASNSNSIRMEAFRTISSLDGNRSRDIALEFLKESSLELQVEAVEVLSSDKAEAIKLGKAILDKSLRKELLSTVTRALKKYETDIEVKGLIVQINQLGLKELQTLEGVKKLKILTAQKGDPKRGREIYLNPELVSCTKCHQMEGFGGFIGPDLTRTWQTQSFDKALEAILEPSKEIKENYQTIEVITTDEKIYSGLRDYEDKKEIRLKNENGQILRFLKQDLESIRESKVSLMPENTLINLSLDQVADLMAFLGSRREQENIKRMGLEFWTIGPFSDDRNTAHSFVKGSIDFKARVKSEMTNNLVEWKRVKTSPDGYLDLFSLYKKTQASAYAVTSIDSSVDQKVTLILGSDDGIQVWVNGELVHTNIVPRGASPDSDRVVVGLKKGTNTIVVRVYNGDLAHGLFFRVDESSGVDLRVTAR